MTYSSRTPLSHTTTTTTTTVLLQICDGWVGYSISKCSHFDIKVIVYFVIDGWITTFQSVHNLI